MSRLTANREGKDFLVYLETALAEAQEIVAMSDDPARVRAYQGAVRTLLDLQRFINPKSNPVSN